MDEREGKLPSIDPSGHLAACCCYVWGGGVGVGGGGVPYESPHITALRSYEILLVKPLVPRFHCPEGFVTCDYSSVIGLLLEL